MSAICVVVDGKRQEKLLKTENGASGSLALTTLEPDQETARIQILNTDDKVSQHLYTLVIEEVPHPRPALDVRGRISDDTLHLEFDLDGETFHTKDIHLHDRRGRRWLMLIPAALLVAVIAPFLYSLTTVAVANEQTTGEKPAEVAVEETAEDSTDEAEAADEQEGGEDTSVEGERVADASETEGTDTSADAGAAEAEETAEATVQAISETVYFEPDLAILTEETKATLQTLVTQLSSSSRLEFVGHCALAGTEKGRVELSVERARAVSNFLRDLGWDPETEPSVTGLGGREPITTDQNLQHLNRRVEITTTGG